MKRYSAERKEAIIQKMMPPENTPISLLVKEMGISDVTLYAWRKQARSGGFAVPANGKNSTQWSSGDKFAIVLETATLSEVELSEYCRNKGLFVEQITAWKQSCQQSNGIDTEQMRSQKEAMKTAKKKIKALERELERKEKALAETAALLVLKKKAQAIWGDEEDE